MTSSIFVFKQRNMLFKKHKDASADNYRPKTANPEKMIVNILRSDFDRNQVRVSGCAGNGRFANGGF